MAVVPSPLIAVMRDVDVSILADKSEKLAQQFEQLVQLYAGLTYNGVTALGLIVQRLKLLTAPESTERSSILQAQWFTTLASREYNIRSSGVFPVLSAARAGLCDVVECLESITPQNSRINEKPVIDECGYSGAQLLSIWKATQLEQNSVDAIHLLLDNCVLSTRGEFPEGVVVWLWTHKRYVLSSAQVLEYIRGAFTTSAHVVYSKLLVTSPRHVLGCLGIPVDPSWIELDRYGRTPAHYQIETGEASGLDGLLAVDAESFSPTNRPGYSLQHAAAKAQLVFKCVSQNVTDCRLDPFSFADAFMFAADGNQFHLTDNNFSGVHVASLQQRFNSICDVPGSHRPFYDYLTNDKLFDVDQELLPAVGNKIEYAHMLKRSKCQHAVARWWHWSAAAVIAQAQARLESQFFTSLVPSVSHQKTSVSGHTNTNNSTLKFNELAYTAALGISLARSELEATANKMSAERNFDRIKSEEIEERSSITFSALIDALQCLKANASLQNRLLDLLIEPADIILHIYAVYDLTPGSRQEKYALFCFKVGGAQTKCQELLAFSCAHHSVNFLKLCLARGCIKLNEAPLSDATFLKYGYANVEDLVYVGKDMSLLARYPVSLCGVTPLMLYIIGKYQAGAKSHETSLEAVRFVEAQLINQYVGLVDEQGNPALAYALLMNDMWLSQQLEIEGNIQNCFGYTPYQMKNLDIRQSLLLQEQQIDGEMIIYTQKKMGSSSSNQEWLK